MFCSLCVLLLYEPLYGFAPTGRPPSFFILPKPTLGALDVFDLVKSAGKSVFFLGVDVLDREVGVESLGLDVGIETPLVPEGLITLLGCLSKLAASTTVRLEDVFGTVPGLY